MLDKFRRKNNPYRGAFRAPIRLDSQFARRCLSFAPKSRRGSQLSVTPRRRKPWHGCSGALPIFKAVQSSTVRPSSTGARLSRYRPPFHACRRALRLNADPARLLTQASALANASSRSPREIINPHRRYGDMPLIVLTSGRHPMPPAIPAVVRHQATLYFQALASGHVALAKLSTRGQNQLVPDSGHFIQFDNPSVVLAMVNRVLEEIRPQPTKAAVDPLFRNASVCCSSRRQAERLPSPSAIRFITLGLTQA